MYKLLIVDDECLIRQGLKNVIPWQDLGFTVIGDANCGKAALELAHNKHPDVILTDIRMPDMTGLELTSVLQKEFPALHTVIISGYNEFDYAVKALKLRVEDYILKPIEPKEIKRVFIQLKSKLDIDAKREMYQRNIRYAYTEFEKIYQQLEDMQPDSGGGENLAMLRKSLIEHLETGDDVEKIVEKILAEANKNGLNPANAYLFVLHDLSRYFQVFDWHPSEVLQAGVFSESVFEIPAEQLTRTFLWDLDTLKKRISNQGGSGASVLAGRARRLIEKLYHDPSLSLSLLAEKLNVSYGYLSMVFSKIIGIRFSAYLSEVRMKKACQFLRRRSLKIYEVAALTGFSGARYFSDTFKKRYGVSPAAYARGIGAVSQHE